MSRLQIILIIAGLMISYTGYQESQLAGLAAEIPQELTLAELEQNGPGDNAHLLVSDFVLCTWDYVYVEKRSSWSEVWIPAVPLYGEYFQGLLESTDETGYWPDDFEFPAPDDVRVLMKLTSASDEEAVDEIAALDTIQGMIINEIESLGSGEADLLAETYPNVDFDTCLIFEHGREPTSSDILMVYFVGGGLLVLLGLGLWLRSRRRDAEEYDEEEYEDTDEDEGYEEEEEAEDGADNDDGERLDAAR